MGALTKQSGCHAALFTKTRGQVMAMKEASPETATLVRQSPGDPKYRLRETLVSEEGAVQSCNHRSCGGFARESVGSEFADLGTAFKTVSAGGWGAFL